MTQLDDPEALADAKIVADAFGIHYEPFKQGLIARARRERLQRVLLRFLPVVAVCCVIAWFGFAAWKNSKIHVIDMSGAEVSLAEFPKAASVTSLQSFVRLTTTEAAFVDVAEYPTANGVIRADISLQDSAQGGIIIRRFESDGTRSILALVVNRSVSRDSPEISMDLSVYSFTATGTGTSTCVRRVLRTTPAGTLGFQESAPIAIAINGNLVSVEMKDELMFSQDIGDLAKQFQARNLRGRIGIVAYRGSFELRNLSFQAP